jgi:hypothetical protein
VSWLALDQNLFCTIFGLGSGLVIGLRELVISLHIRRILHAVEHVFIIVLSSLSSENLDSWRFGVVR